MNLKEFRKDLVAIALTGVVMGSCIKALPTKYLKSEDFQNAEWVEVDNKSPRGIWGYYMKEDIAHTALNWETYQREVKKKNDGKISGKISLPDLDEDGLVAE